MQEYKRENPLFALCGLNCGLCPRYHTEGTSKCPGCGGPDFHLKHPTCSVITCNKMHDSVEFCFQCSLFPCRKYMKASSVDSFVSYKNVINDFKIAQGDLKHYQEVINNKVEILEVLLKKYNDGRRKSYYCLAANLLSLDALKTVLDNLEKGAALQDIDQKGMAKIAVSLIGEMAKKEGVKLELRK